MWSVFKYVDNGSMEFSLDTIEVPDMTGVTNVIISMETFTRTPDYVTGAAYFGKVQGQTKQTILIAWHRQHF